MSRRKKYRKKHKRLGLCSNCSEPSVGGTLLCKKHREYDRSRNLEKSAKMRQQYREEGRCVRCGIPLIDFESGICTNCQDQVNRRKRNGQT